MKHSFQFTAHVIGTDREIEFAITVPENISRPFADIADDAEEKALAHAAQEFGVPEGYIEVISE